MSLGGIRKKRKQFGAPKLMLTSMMDMFTIVLIFLLCSFSDEPESIKLNKDLELPVSSAEKNYEKNLRLVLTKNSLMLDDEKIADLKNGKINGVDEKDLKKSLLYTRLREHSEQMQKTEDENQGDEQKNQDIVFLCDKSHEFRVINQVIKTAGLAGYPNFQFAVLQE